LASATADLERGVEIVDSTEDVVRLQRHQAVALVSSAQWMRHRIRSGEFEGDPEQQRVALAQLQEAIDAMTDQLERQFERLHRPRSGKQWRGYLLAVAAVLGATLVIKACCLLGSPRTVDGLYIPVIVGVAMLIGRWPALLACALAFVLNDMLFVNPGRFAPSPEQIAVLLVVSISCLALTWLVPARTSVRLLGPFAARTTVD
jgi:K+-sensing histidine kinase KdpD